MKIDWNNIYLVGWSSKDGKRNLTQWAQSNGRLINVVVVGATDNDMSHIMWNNPLHKMFDMLLIPAGEHLLEYAASKNGIRAFGFYYPEGINRPPMRTLIDPWEWFNTLKGKQNG